ncbi:Similar to Acadvl: Very long-chain specific acyl-CoA dehydrogenase [Cotesia congregata]|uniref:Very long-chain specific acyl-CoA dehydrogenase, mitochondrial n=1 Tax=Cotesia congregata TaxID=51543 RepID=A0A8J2HM28_COTCN|nr:Similar to Acadvl: Very long-chain specific acyl-CoA dehydrogenase [Cotesia congregata]
MLSVSKIISLTPKHFNKFVKLNTRCLATQTAAKENPAKETKEKKESLSFTMNLFRSQLQLEQVIPFPKALNSDQSETLKMLVDPFSNFFAEVNDPVKNDDTADVDDKIKQTLWDLGGFSIQVPEKYGGIGLNNTQYARLVEIVGQNDLGVGIMLGAHQSIGFKGILLYGTPEQKEKYLTRVSNGEYAAFALTEPSCGSDAGSVKTRAVKSADGTHYVMNGSKIWISNGGWANIFTVFAKVPMKDPVTGETTEKVTAFIVDRAFGGVTNGPPEKKMGIKCSNTAEVFFEDVKVPAENVLVGEGQGFKVAMNILNNGRFGMVAALSGTMQSCIKKAVEFANQRVQFGKTINQYGSIQEKIARMSMHQYVFASESAWYVCDEAIQILGGMGYMKDTGLERVMRDVRIFRIFEGTNDILRLFVALTGIQHAGGHLQELQRAFKNPAANLGLIFEEAAKRATKAVGLGSTPTFAHLLHPILAESANLTGKSIENFGQTVEGLLIKYGRGIVNEQFILNRLAQAAIDTYTSVVVLSRASQSLNNKIPSAEHESVMAKVWCSEAASRTAYNLKVVKSEKSLELFNQMKTISRNVCEVGECAQNTPLGF